MTLPPGCRASRRCGRRRRGGVPPRRRPAGCSLSTRCGGAGRHPCLPARNKTSVACMIQCPRVKLCNLTTCYYIESVSFTFVHARGPRSTRRRQGSPCTVSHLTYDKLLSICAFNVNLGHYNQALRGRHILYAEDSVPSQMIVKRMLDRAGVQVTVWRCRLTPG